jgi:hypothetical protein
LFRIEFVARNAQRDFEPVDWTAKPYRAFGRACRRLPLKEFFRHRNL